MQEFNEATPEPLAAFFSLDFQKLHKAVLER